MERWAGRVVMVTGASAGIGAALVKELVRKGMVVVGVARRPDRVEAMKAELSDFPGKLHAVKCDIRVEADVLAAFAWINANLGGVDVLVNNAGVVHTDMELASGHGKTEYWRDVFDVNIIGLSMCTREALKRMRERGVDDGHIIHINSICGHRVTDGPAPGMYCASKHALTALTENLRRELVRMKSRIKVTSLSPGHVKTDIMIAAGVAVEGDYTPYDKNPHLSSEEVADSIVYVISTPPSVQIHELIIKPVGEWF